MMQKDRVEKRAAKPQPIRAMDLIDYQKDAVVSREILKCNGGSVTVFAFDQAEGLSEHTVPHEAVVHVLEGEFEISIAGKAMVVREGEMLIMPANKPHAVKALQNSKMILVMIKN
jgi:quercetin dioxygenase-like cupin family protein